jgi:hypothetical protein
MKDGSGYRQQSQLSRGGDSLADILDRVLDKGVVIAGDIRINLLDIELLTIKVRLLIASVDKAQEMGINWWSYDPHLTHRAAEQQEESQHLKQENRQLRERLERLESAMSRLVDQGQQTVTPGPRQKASAK